jgi:multisubunit Na+/H+ antiporter MnhE subunit
MVLDSEMNGSGHSLSLNLVSFFMHAVLGALSKLRQVTTSFVVSVCPSVLWNNSAPTGRIFMNLAI